MNYPSIRIEGAILSPDILEKLEDAVGQKPADFGFDGSVKVKDEIARAWADAQDYWRIFQRRLEGVRMGAAATSETRNLWIAPLLGLLGYQLEYQQRGVELNGKVYAISHRVVNRGQTPIHILGWREPAGLDRKPENATLRMSAHGLVQEYLNLHDELYGLVTNGRLLRLLRDSSRLVKLTYLEFDLERIFSDGLFADFALLYRLLHASRLPAAKEQAAASLIERYHQDSLDSGTRIREGLSRAVEQAIRDFANGFLAHPANDALRQAVAAGQIAPSDYYRYLLNLIYRLLFLLVIEERDLVYPPGAPRQQRQIYENYYSVQRLRRLAEKRYLADRRHHDLWLSLQATFQLFAAAGPGQKLSLAPLAGDLFHPAAIGPFHDCTLGNDVLLGCLRALGLYHHPDTRQMIRVNYAALNVEELGSVYEGLLKLVPTFDTAGRQPAFLLRPGADDTQSHYTADDLVQPLLKHSLDYLIAERLQAPNPEKALLALRVADISCGSGHILLAAARRIATALATVRTGEEQPSPAAFRGAVRDVIRECIYGVDLNPLAVELCKVALWLEAHNPGEPLNFLDHHIKCGNAIVGYVRPEDVGERGVPDEAFTTMPGDDKKVAATLRQRNKAERKQRDQLALVFAPERQRQLADVLRRWRQIAALPEQTPAQIAAKKEAYTAFAEGGDAWLLNQLAAIPIAQFYLPKTTANQNRLMTDGEFRPYWRGDRVPQGQATGEAWGMALRKRFFHWFLEFPEIVAQGGFDCILGNPPYLGGTHLSGTYGYPFCYYVKWEYAPAGLSDLVAYFVRRIYSLLKPGGFTAFITTNSIKDGDIRKDGLEQVMKEGGQISFAVRGVKWPGQANLVVSLVAVHKGKWKGKFFLDGKEVPTITSYFEDIEDIGEPLKLKSNSYMVLTGVTFLGDGFLIEEEETKSFLQADPRNIEVIAPLINGDEVNNHPEQRPGRNIINFFDWPIHKAETYEEPFQRVLTLVKPKRETDNREIYRRHWWMYAEARQKLTAKLEELDTCFAVARTTKHLNFSALPANYIFSDALKVFATDRWDLYAVVQSTLHEVWARKYSGALKQDLRYSPSKCFDTFPFPTGLWQTADPALAAIGEQYHEHRRALMRQLWLGLTPIYNLFHDPALTPALVAKVSKQPEDVAEAGYYGLLELRRRHVALDHAIRDAYGWHPAAGSGQGLDLGHDFYEVETLPENDRVRYTISPDARKEVLRRLLALNHERAAEEAGQKSSTSAQKMNFSEVPAKLRQSKPGKAEPAGPLKLQPPPAPAPKAKPAPRPDLAAQPTLVTEFTPPQGSFAQRLKRVNAIVQPQNQMELAELIAALGDENGQIRWLAGASLARLADMATVTLLAAYLKTNPAPVAKEEALKVLTLIGEMSESEEVKEAAKGFT